jgi:gamma-glutamylcyclotransferase (GGCT)/AIG2-like uncharacterized protein YtfP
MADPTTDISAFFVYGTLKTGQLRSTVWPHRPNRIRSAVVQAELFDLGPYPAALLGQGLVLGELWEFSPSNLPDTLRILDEVEGYSPTIRDRDYLRRPIDTIPVEDNPAQSTVKAWIYLSPGADRLVGARRMKPFKEIASEVLGEKLDWHRQIAAYWPDPQSRVPRSFSEE